MNWKDPLIRLDLRSGMLAGATVKESIRRIGDLADVFEDEALRASMDPSVMVYSVQAWMPVQEGKEGGLFFGNSTIYPGRVGREYFMTRGHYHENRDTAEYYWCITGEGALLLMDTERRVDAEKMSPGSLHYIPGNTAHRVVNTGSIPLVFNACWPSDAGHNYKDIDMLGFSARLVESAGKPVLVSTDDRTGPGKGTRYKE